jgi:hypothetical protein
MNKKIKRKKKKKKEKKIKKKQHVPLKRRSTIILHGSTTQKTALNVIVVNV